MDSKPHEVTNLEYLCHSSTVLGKFSISLNSYGCGGYYGNCIITTIALLSTLKHNYSQVIANVILYYKAVEYKQNELEF